MITSPGLVIASVNSSSLQAFMFFLQQLACICSLVACIVGNSELSDVAHVISCMSNLVYWT
jgi:hypothetical protein